MIRKNIIWILGIIVLLIISIMLIFSLNKRDELKTNNIEATVLTIKNGEMTVQDKDNIIYTFGIEDASADIGENINIEYTGLLDKNKNMQNVKVIGYKTVSTTANENGIPSDWLDNGIFSDFYILANNKLKELSLDEKIGQLFLVRYPDSNAITDLIKYKFGGYVFYEKNFTNKTQKEVKDMINKLQKVANIPILTAVDEEGGKVVRISSNPNLVSEKFKSSKELYNLGGFDKIKQDTIEKSEILNNLGINLNLAPVVDVSNNPSDYMYERAFGQNTELTSTYSKTVIEASKGTGVSYTLKHFPGYGNNSDTHSGSSVDTRTYDEIVNNDLPPFKSGINVGAEAVLVSHNIVNSIDSSNPASLSSSIHNLLRNELGFTGIIITDDLAMSAVSSIDNAVVKAILAGNDLIITTDYENDIKAVKTAIEDGTIDENLINKLSFRVLAWKYYKGIMFDEK